MPESVFRTPEEKRLLIEALRVLFGGKDDKPRETAERMTAMLETRWGELFGPEGNGK